MELRSAVVVGGGAAGLAAAYRLSERGVRVTMLESAEVVGGLLATEEIGACHVDTAVQLLSTTYTRLYALATDAGAAGRFIRASGRDALWRNGSAREITYGSLSSMATSSALPTFLKLKLAGKYVPFLTMNASGLDANDPASTGGLPHDHESIASWGTRELGSDFVELLVYPLLAAYYGSVPEKTSAALYHALARVGMDVEVNAVRGGMAALARDIAAACVARGAEVRTAVRVERIERVAGDRASWRVQTEEGSHDCDGVVIATPPHVARMLLDDVHMHTDGDDAKRIGDVAAWLAGASTTPGATIAVELQGTMRAEYFGLSFPRGAAPGDRIAALAIQQNKPASLIPAGRSALLVFPAPGAADVAEMSDDDARTYILPALERAFPGIGQRIASVVVCGRDARYRGMEPGFVRRIAELRRLTMPQGLVLAGDYTMVPTVEGAVRSGERAVELLSRL